MSDRLTMSVLQHVPVPLDVESGIKRLRTALAQASDEGAELLVVPEASLTGYNVSPKQAEEIAQQEQADCHEQLGKYCQQLGIGLAYGYIERDGDVLFNSVSVLSDSGDPIAHYRKTHLWGDLDRALFAPGEDLSPIVDFRGWQLGLLICYDIEFPETVRRLSLEGAELLLVPTALMAPYDFVAKSLVPTRAAESQLFIAYANYCGSENGLNYTGRSCIVSPAGEVLSRAEEAEATLMTRTLERSTLERIRRELPYLQNRRPELYSTLTTGGQEQ